MDYERYVETCKQLNVPIEEDKIPPCLEDFPDYVLVSINIFNTLPDTFSGGMEPIFSGKDLAALPVLLDIYEVEKEDYLYILDVLSSLINRTRHKAISDAKKANKSKVSKPVN